MSELAHVPLTVNVAGFDRAGVEFVDPREGARGCARHQPGTHRRRF